MARDTEVRFTDIRESDRNFGNKIGDAVWCSKGRQLPDGCFEVAAGMAGSAGQYFSAAVSGCCPGGSWEGEIRLNKVYKTGGGMAADAAGILLEILRCPGNAVNISMTGLCPGDALIFAQTLEGVVGLMARCAGFLVVGCHVYGGVGSGTGEVVEVAGGNGVSLEIPAAIVATETLSGRFGVGDWRIFVQVGHLMAGYAVGVILRAAAMASGAAGTVLSMGFGMAVSAAFGGYVLIVIPVAVDAAGSLGSIMGRKQPLLGNFHAGNS